jgi:hypothetical protein
VAVVDAGVEELLDVYESHKASLPQKLQVAGMERLTGTPSGVTNSPTTRILGRKPP